MAPTRIALILSATLLAGCSVFGGRAAEEPGYSLVAEEGDFEIRRYPELVIARTTVAAEDRDAAVGTGFGRLFDYITGENGGWRDAPGREGGEIEMTAPVIVEDAEGGEIAMTAPVLVEGEGGAWTTAFVLPEDATMETAPIPSAPEVELATIAPREVGVVRFSGFLSAENVAENRARLDAWLAERGRAHADDWQSAGYNPPWTLPFLRRNEVLVTLE